MISMVVSCPPGPEPVNAGPTPIGRAPLLPGGGGERRQSPVRRIDDLRRTQTRHRHFVPKTVSPERVVSIRGFFARRSIGGFSAKIDLSLLRRILKLGAG